MTELLDDVLKLTDGLLLTGFAVFLRVGAAMALLPGFGEQTIPPRVRLGLALAFTAVIFPAVADPVKAAYQAVPLPMVWLAAEVICGLALGFILRLFVFALQAAGAIIAQATSLSQMFGGVAGEPSAAVGTLMLMAGLALAMSLGLPARVAEALILSYDALPPGEIAPASLIADWGVSHVAHAFSLAFSLSAPFVIASLLFNVALGVMNRAMPQLMVAFVGAPALTGGALLLMMVALPAILSLWWQSFAATLSDPFGPVP